LGNVPTEIGCWPSGRHLTSRSLILRALRILQERNPDDQILALIRLAKANGLGDLEQVESLLTYVQANRPGFYGADRLRKKLSAKARLLCVYGSGAVEKHIDLVICRRFPGLQGRQRPRHALDPKGR